MRFFGDIPIRRKLAIAMMLASGLALAVTTLVIVGYDLATFRSRAVRDLQGQAELIASSTQGALHFDDPKTARLVLEGLKPIREIVAASIYKSDGIPFVTYRRDDASDFQFPAVSPDATRLDGGHLEIFRRILSDNEVIGTIYLSYDLQPVLARLSQYVALVGIVLLALVVAYLLLATLLRRLISQPLLSLSQAARSVTEQKDYSVRAAKSAKDEIGQLTDAFNQMLETIAARDNAVQMANKELEERSRELQKELSERKRTQKALQQSEEKWRALAESAPDIISTLARDGTILFMNRVLPGFNLNEVIGSSVYDYVPGESRATLRKCLEHVFKTGETAGFETEGAGANGATAWYSSRMGPIRHGGEIVAVTLIATDITSRKHTEEKVQLLACALESNSEMISITDLQFRFIYVNNAFVEAYGYAPGEILGQSANLLFAPVSPAPFVQQVIEQTQRTGWKGEALHQRKSGEVFPVSLSTSSIRTAEGKSMGYIAVARDITDRKRAEEALRHSEERYRRFFEEDLTGDYTAVPDGHFLACNPAFATMFGFTSREDAVRGNLADLHQSGQAYEDFLAMLRKEKKLTYHETELRRLDGKPVFVIQNVIGVFDASGQLAEFAGYVFDITQHKTVEEHLRQALKMEAVGRLAGGIAHDFNNLLLAILGFSDVLLGELDSNSTCREEVHEIQKAAERAATLTRQLLAYSRKQVLQPQIIDLNSIVHEVSKMLRRMIGEDIELITITDPALGQVKADPGQIEQVIINLAVNARDAMPHGGKLTLRTANFTVGEGASKWQLETRPGPYVLLAITDTGRGMTPEIKSHLFEPFFTTKDVGKGTGLGLSTVYGIVKQSGGDIQVESELGLGTTFKILLPRIEQTSVIATRNKTASEQLTGSETILVVEDEAAVRSLLRRVLEKNGYSVLEAADGKAALELCSSYPGTIHLMIADIVMPQMNGRELAERLSAVRRDVKVLFISGYTDDAVIRYKNLPPSAAFLSKPFVPDVLLQKLRELLAGPAPTN